MKIIVSCLKKKRREMHLSKMKKLVPKKLSAVYVLISDYIEEKKQNS
jgi:hypothetical protein